MSLLSDLNKNQRTPHKQNLLGLYNSSQLHLWGNTVIESLSNCLSLGVHIWTSCPFYYICLILNDYLATHFPASLRLEFPGSCFSCYSPQNTKISSSSMRTRPCSMIWAANCARRRVLGDKYHLLEV